MQLVISSAFKRSLAKTLPLLLISRFILCLCGTISARFIGIFHPRPYYLHPTGFKCLDIWGFGDTGWYLDIAEKGYSSQPIAFSYNQSNIGFFPLFPKLIHLLGLLTGNYFIAGLILSNVMLLLGCCYLFMLLEKYLAISKPLNVLLWFLLIPGAFMLSAVFSESTLFCMSVIAFYYGYKDNWPMAGLFGMLAALTKPSGILIIVPLFIIYLKRYGLSQFQKALFLALIPLGTLSFGIYCYICHHDFFAYVHSKNTGWGTSFDMPWHTIYVGLQSHNGIVFWNTIYTVAILILLIAGFQLIRFELWLFTLLQIFFPLTNGPVNLVCMFRYTIILFPLAMILYRIKLPEIIKFLLATVLIYLQLMFMISFSNCMDYIG